MGVEDLGPATRLPTGRKARETAAQESDEEDDDDDESDDEEDEEEEEEAPSPHPVGPIGPGLKRSRQVGRTISAKVLAKRRLAQLDLPDEDVEVTLPRAEGYDLLFPYHYLHA